MFDDGIEGKELLILKNPNSGKESGLLGPNVVRCKNSRDIMSHNRALWRLSFMKWPMILEVMMWILAH